MGKRALITSVLTTMVSAALVVSITSCQGGSGDETVFSTSSGRGVGGGGAFFDTGNFPPDFGPDDGGGAAPPFNDEDGGGPLSGAVVKCASFDEDGGDAAVDTEPGGESPCDTPPASGCADALTMVVYTAGYCFRGYCQFDTSFTSCSGGCFRGLNGRFRCNE